MITIRKLCFVVAFSAIFYSVMVDCAPTISKKSLDWRHLIAKRSTDKIQSSATTKTKETPKEQTQKETDEFDTVKGSSLNRKGDEDIDEQTERTIDWGLLEGNSNDLNEEMASRRRRRNVFQSTNANRQRSRTTKISHNKYRQLPSANKQQKNKNHRYRVKRALYDDGQQISETDLEKLAYLVSELQQLNEEERRLEDNDDDDDVVYAPSDDVYYYPQYQALAPQMNDDELARLAQWWRNQQQKIESNRYAVRKRSPVAQYYPDAADDDDADVDDDDDEAEPIQVFLLNPSTEDEDDDDDVDENDVRNTYVGYPIMIPNDAIESPYQYDDNSNPTYYAYNIGDDDSNRRSDEIELEKRITSLARFLNSRSKRR